jgi:hypothetical protein
MKLKSILVFLLFIPILFAGPVLQMNNAINSLIELFPYIMDEGQFKDKKNELSIKKSMKDLNATFKLAGHDSLIKHDLFAPSYELILNHISESEKAFNIGKKDYSFWRLQGTFALCIDCHTRLPSSMTSSFQNGELILNTNKIPDPYHVGLAYMTVRRFIDAKENFTRSIQDKIIKKESNDIILPFQQILMIETKIKKDPDAMISIIDGHLNKKNLPYPINTELMGWKKRLQLWKDDAALSRGLTNETQLKQFIKRRLEPLKNKNSFKDAYKVDLLFSSGIISHYFFENQASPSAPELSFWLGWIEKRLKKEEFIGPGDLFLKQCIRKYYTHSIAKECLREYRESIEFDFSGSGGISIPPEIEKEYQEFNKLVYPYLKKL